MNQISEEAYQYLQQSNYQQAQIFYEQAIALNSEIISNYWYLGLALLFQGEEVEAQTTWLSVLMEAEDTEAKLWISELIQILETESQKQESWQNYHISWLIRQHLKEIAPEYLDNILVLIQLSIKLNSFDATDILITELLELSTSELDFNHHLLGQTLVQIISSSYQSNLTNNLISFYLSYAQNNQDFGNILLTQSEEILIQESKPSNIIIKIAEIVWQLQDDSIPAFVASINAYTKIGKFQESIVIAERFLNSSDNFLDKLAAYYATIKSLLAFGGKFEKAQELNQEQINLIKSIIDNPNLEINNKYKYTIIAITSLLSYFEDNPQQTNYLRQKFSDLFQSRIREFLSTENIPLENLNYTSTNTNQNQTPKIGYISSCLYRHSVGQLSRWLLQYHNREQFPIYIYSLEKRNDDIQNLLSQIPNFKDISYLEDIIDIIKIIQQDQIDILVDLDSLTSPKICAVMAVKPAPIQVTWLGFDASGLPAIDYFITDPYSLTESAQEYYTEKIWRLPNSLIAVDGFEIGVPTVTRNQLDIPEDGIVYFSSQTGYKRHPDNVALQIKIIKEVPNSYFLIKSWNTDSESFKQFFTGLAEKAGISQNRLRFLPVVASEEIHRANLAIADVVLDTYPYNGATTTLETLWMGIPLVTRVGEQFSARNSYTMMVNAGISEGIAWTDQEYLDWGIRLGLDEQLRQQIHFKLKKSRQRSPLWNAKQFTRDMEECYRQMWRNYCEKSFVDS